MAVETITNILKNIEGEFNLPLAYSVVQDKIKVNKESIRARIYEAIDKGILKRIAKGIFSNNNCLLIQGDGRKLDFIKDESIDAIICDHPYKLDKSNIGGNRNFSSTYDCFLYEQEDFDEKARVLKNGHFLIEFIPEENADNWQYLARIKEMAQKSGFCYYAKVAWKKGKFVSNCGRKSKNTEDILIFTKGVARTLRIDAKKNKANPQIQHFMSGANGMLPTCFDFEKPSRNTMIHQAEKNVKLLESLLDYFTLEGETVLDTFAGSGSTGEACINKKRNCILIEISEKFCNAIKNRLKLNTVYCN